MKKRSIYWKLVNKAVIFLGLFLLLLLQDFIGVNSVALQWALRLYYIVLIAFSVFLIRRPLEIEDEMVMAIYRKSDSITSTVTQIFLIILICLLSSPSDFTQQLNMTRDLVGLILSAYLLFVEVLRIIIFSYCEKRGI